MCHINTHTLFLNHLMESYIRHGPFNVFKGEVYFLKSHSTVINLSKFNIATLFVFKPTDCIPVVSVGPINNALG